MQNFQVELGAVLALKSAKLSARRPLSFADRRPAAPDILAATEVVPGN